VVEHALTWSVRDSAALLDAITGAEGGTGGTLPGPVRPYAGEVTRDPGSLRIAMTGIPFLGHDVDSNCLRALEETADLLRHLGHEVVEAAPVIQGRSFARAFLTMVAVEFRTDLGEAERAIGRIARRGDMELASWTLARLGGAIPAPRYTAALRELDRTTRIVNQFFTEWDILLTPTLAAPPVLHGALQPPAGEQRVMRLLGALPGGGWLLDRVGALEKGAETAFDFIPWTPLFNVTGQPAMSVPLAWSPEGLPVGMHFAGRFGDEATLFRLAGQLEREAPWARRRPPGHEGDAGSPVATDRVPGS
jgi:amidase